MNTRQLIYYWLYISLEKWITLGCYGGVKIMCFMFVFIERAEPHVSLDL